MLRLGQRIGYWIAAALLLVVASAALRPADAPAQSIADYGILGEGGSSSSSSSSSAAGETAEVATSDPPPGAFSTPGDGSPALSDYGAIADYSPDPVLSRAQQELSIFFSRLQSIADRVPEAFDQILLTLAIESPTGKPSYFIGVLLFALLLVTIGRAVTQIYAVYVARPIFVRQQRPQPIGLTDKLPVLLVRVLMTLVGTTIVLAVAATIGLFFYQDHKATLLTVNIVFGTYVLLRVTDTFWRVMLSPYLPPYRIPKITDAKSRRLYHSLMRATNFAIVAVAFCLWFEALGLAREIHVLITIGLMFAVVIGFLVVILRNHRTVSEAILGGKRPEEANWVSFAASRIWAPAVAAYLLIAWGDCAFRLVMGLEGAMDALIGAYLTVILGVSVYVATAYAIERSFTRSRQVREANREAADARAAEDALIAAETRDQASQGGSADVDDDGDDEAGGSPRDPARRGLFGPRPRRPGMQTMEDLARRGASLFALGMALYTLVHLWGGAEMFRDGSTFDFFQDLIDTMFLGYLAFHAARIWIDQKIADEGVDDEPSLPGEGEGGGAGATRLATLLPLVRNFILIVISLAIALTVATQLGVNVAPLFAGAGIVGLAIGFGSQTLVRDILSGAFFLMDDAFRKGEYVDVGDVKGTVEKISLRSFQLRHHLGMLHTIPFGEIQFLTNFSRDWVIMKLPLRLTYDTDVEKVRKLIKKLGIALLEDPEIGPNFLQPLKSQGVYMMEDSAMIIRVKFMTKPGDQWVVRKKVYAEIRALFEREGIKFAHREVTVRIPEIEGKTEFSEEERQAIGAAARRATDAADEAALQGPPSLADAR